jgi:hypothetical protein
VSFVLGCPARRDQGFAGANTSSTVIVLIGPRSSARMRGSIVFTSPTTTTANLAGSMYWRATRWTSAAWFLYEGTPGGQLDEAGDEVVRSTGERTAASEHWQARLPVPRWVYVSAARLNRSIFVVHHEDDGDGDQYWPMEGNMTVFGFGREYRCCGKSLRAVPARFSVGLVESRDPATVTRAIESMLRDLWVEVGPR